MAWRMGDLRSLAGRGRETRAGAGGQGGVGRSAPTAGGQGGIGRTAPSAGGLGRTAPDTSLELGGDNLGIGAQRIQPVDDEAPQSRIGAVNQPQENLLGLAHANESHRRPSLCSASRSLTCSGLVSLSAGFAFFWISASNRGIVCGRCSWTSGKSF